VVINLVYLKYSNEKKKELLKANTILKMTR